VFLRKNTREKSNFLSEIDKAGPYYPIWSSSTLSNSQRRKHLALTGNGNKKELKREGIQTPHKIKSS